MVDANDPRWRGFFAGLSTFNPDAPSSTDPGLVFGFVIVTTSAESGMLDVHDRRPLVYSLEEGKVWLTSAAKERYLRRDERPLHLECRLWHCGRPTGDSGSSRDD